MLPQTTGRESAGDGRKSVSYYDRKPVVSERPPQIPLPGSHSKLVNTLVASSGTAKLPESGNQRLTKLLLNVTIQRSPGPVQVVISAESTVSDLIKAAVETYVREGRRALLTEIDPLAYELHYSQFSLDSLDTTAKLGNLGSRNFFLCSKPQNEVNTWSNQATKASKGPVL
ncbi:uncharacterized protein At4g22758-like [Aristolochia californica]|uniref:uncharacterized protein At4g22758-like n=1 Tax=Aristolochia californica TaxID=171875 RepID=UPI0035D794DB